MALMGRRETTLSIRTPRATSASVADHAFSLWLLSLPFGIYSIWSTYSVDNLMAPLLLILAPFATRSGTYLAEKNWLRSVMAGGSFIFIYALGIIIPVWNTGSVSNQALITAAKHSIYAIIPLLFIRDYRRLQLAEVLIIICAVLGGISALLASVGILSLPITRFEHTRIGVDVFEKAIGLFASYGDVAIISGFAAAYLAFIPSKRAHPLMARKLARAFVVLALLAGIVGCQSRSVILSIAVAVIFGWGGILWARKKGMRRTLFALAVAVVVCAVAIYVVWFFDAIVSLLMNWGGAGARGTAGDRVEQYSKAFALLHDNYWFGISPDAIAANENHIVGIHNLWLRTILVGGIFGAICIAAPLVWILVVAFRLLKNETLRGHGAVVLGALGAILTATQFYPGDTLLYWVVVGVTMSARSCLIGTPQERSDRTASSQIAQERTPKFVQLRFG